MSTLKLPISALPAAIGESVAATLKAHGLSLSPELLVELGGAAARALTAIDVSPADAEPSVADRLRVGESLRGIANEGGWPDPEMPAMFGRVGDWLRDGARAELAVAMGGTVAGGGRAA